MLRVPISISMWTAVSDGGIAGANRGVARTQAYRS